MTVRELKAFLADVPDEYLVVTFNTGEEFWAGGKPALCYFDPADKLDLMTPDRSSWDPAKHTINAVAI